MALTDLICELVDVLGGLLPEFHKGYVVLFLPNLHLPHALRERFDGGCERGEIEKLFAVTATAPAGVAERSGSGLPLGVMFRGGLPFGACADGRGRLAGPERGRDDRGDCFHGGRDGGRDGGDGGRDARDR